jgi:hypothetical protein
MYKNFTCIYFFLLVVYFMPLSVLTLCRIKRLVDNEQ